MDFGVLISGSWILGSGFFRRFWDRSRGLKWFLGVGSGGDACESLREGHCRPSTLGNCVKDWILDLGIWILDLGSWSLDLGVSILDLVFFFDFGVLILDFGSWSLDLGVLILDFDTLNY